MAARLFALLARLRRPGGTAGEPPPDAAPIAASEVAPPAPLVIADLQAWAARGGHTVRFEAGGDRYEIAGEELRLEAEPGAWSAAAPRLAFPSGSELPFLRPDGLAPLEPDAGPYAAVFSIDGGPPVSWDSVASQLPPGDQGLLGDTGQLLRLGLIAPEQVAAALDQARPGEALDQAIARLGLAGLDAWVEAFRGRPFVTPPAGRPFADRLGMRLLAGGAIAQGQLKEALHRQAAPGEHQPLGRLLGLPEDVLAKALAQQSPLHPQLPEADGLGEVLIRWGCVTRGDWARARRAGASPELALVKAGKLLPAHLERARAYREALSRHLGGRTVRLGQVLVRRGLDPAEIAKALARQADQPLHLAELLVLHRLVGPAEAARALGEQFDGFRKLAESGLPPLMTPPRPAAIAARPAKRRGRFPREAYALAVLGCFALAYAVAAGHRWSGKTYGWLDRFFPPPARTAPPEPGGAVHEISESRGKGKRSGVQRLERLDLPVGRPEGATAGGAIQTALNLDIAVSGMKPTALPGNASTRALPAARATPLELGAGPWTPSAAPWSARIGPRSPAAYPLLPTPRFPAPRFTHDLNARPVSRPTFGLAPDSLSEAPSGSFGYPMERAIALPTPAPVRTEEVEPRVARRFRADLARLLAEEARQRRRGQTLRAAGRDSEAQVALAAAENVRRSQAVFRARIGEAYYRQGDLAAASAELRGATHDDPSFALPRYYLGEIASRRGDKEAAAAAFREYLRLAPEGEFAREAKAGLARAGQNP